MLCLQDRSKQHADVGLLGTLRQLVKQGSLGPDSLLVQDIPASAANSVLQGWFWYKVTEFAANRTTVWPESSRVCAISIIVTGDDIQEDGYTRPNRALSIVRFTSTDYNRYELNFFDNIALDDGAPLKKFKTELSCGPGVAKATVLIDDARLQLA